MIDRIELATGMIIFFRNDGGSKDGSSEKSEIKQTMFTKKAKRLTM